MSKVCGGGARGALSWILMSLAVCFLLLWEVGPADAAEPTPVTARALDTGANAEKVASIPVSSGEPSASNVYSLKVPFVEEGEVLRATGGVELSGSRSYPTTVSTRLVLASGASETSGTAVTPWSATTLAAGSNRLTLPINGDYQAPSELGIRYLQLQVKAASPEAKSGDTLSVTPNSGRLALTRYAPTAGPTSLATDELQPLLGELPEQIATVPVDWAWRVVLSRKVGELSEGDLLEVAGQLEVENTSGAAVKLESKITRTTLPNSATGPWLVQPNLDRLVPGTHIRISNGGEIGPVTDPENKYVNLAVRAIPIEGSPAPLKIVAGSGSLSVLRFKPKPGSPESPLLEGTDEHDPPWSSAYELGTVPFAAEGKEPRVIKSLPIWSLKKGEVVRAHGLLTADLAGGESAPVETALIVANSETATTGETVAPRSGDTVSTTTQIHTIVSEGTYVAPKAATEAPYLNLVVWANRAPSKAGEALKVFDGSLAYSRSQPVAQPPQPAPVTTRELDTGANSELVSSIPIASGEPSPTNVYSLKVPFVEEGEVLRATGGVELSGSRGYTTTVSTRLVLASGASETSGTALTPWSATTLAAGSNRLTLPIGGDYRAASELGTRYLQLQVKAASPQAKSGDTLPVTPNAGRLALTRYAPTAGPTSLETDELQPLLGELPEQIATVPVDWAWRVVLSRKVGELSEGDLLEAAGQLEIQNTSGEAVRFESKITRTTVPNAATGSWLDQPNLDYLAPGAHARISNSGEIGPVTDPENKYVNLAVRVMPIKGAPEPLKIVAGSNSLSVLRFKPQAEDPESPLLEGTKEHNPPWSSAFELGSVPFAAEGKEPRVIKSLPLWSLKQGDVIRVHGMLTANLDGGESAPIETALIVSDSEAATTGETVTPRSGSTISTAAQIGTVYSEGTYVAPKAASEAKYLNLVAWANRMPNKGGEAMKVFLGSLAFSRSQPTAPFKADFEDGSLDQFMQFPENGTVGVTSSQAREGTKALQVDVEPTNQQGSRRVEIRPGDERGAGGHDGEDRWYGFSAYFPEGFKVPTAEGELPAGTWNVFTQLHHTNAGLDCTTSLSPPLAFNVRYFKAGFKYPGETETSVPVSGDYITVGFNGGEINEACDEILKETNQRILSPLERGHWYDFVLHTRWTAELGAPGDSVSEVWLDGKQMLGNETTPILTPTEYWHGNPEIHNTDTYLQFGLYRGPSVEDPASRLFLDSYRTGNSYSQVAPESRFTEPHIEAETFGASLKGAGLPELATNLGPVKCSGTSLEGVAAEPTNAVSLTPKYGECEITVGATKYLASAEPHGCRYAMGVENAGPPYAGTWGIACEKEGEALEFKVFALGKFRNCLKLYPQSDLEGIDLSNTGEGTERAIGLAAEVKGVKYEWLGACGKETRSDGVFKGQTTLAASDSNGKGIGAYLSGYELAP